MATQQITMPECVMELLGFLYPTVDWSRVDFYSGLPWWTAGASAITIPDPVSLGRFRIHMGNLTDPCSPTTMRVIVHEAFHVLQFMSFNSGYGFGMFNPGFVAYLGCFFRNFFGRVFSLRFRNLVSSSYAENPFEIEANDQEGRFRRCYENLHVHVCDCSSGVPVFQESALQDLAACDPTLVKREYEAPRCGTSLFSFLLGLLIGIVAFFAYIFDLLKCQHIPVLRKECSKWAEATRRTCAEWRDHGYSLCSKWEDQGYEACDEWADQGYSTCSQWADQGYYKCCDWWPCSWLCKALVWISNLVCVVTIWVSKMVCVVTVWVTKWVCVATIWISYIVCYAYTVIIEIVCVAFTWYLYLQLFCWI